jgi:hypothetical protein
LLFGVGAVSIGEGLGESSGESLGKDFNLTADGFPV